jgi:hypothetical protein
MDEIIGTAAHLAVSERDEIRGLVPDLAGLSANGGGIEARRVGAVRQMRQKRSGTVPAVIFARAVIDAVGDDFP